MQCNAIQMGWETVQHVHIIVFGTECFCYITPASPATKWAMTYIKYTASITNIHSACSCIMQDSTEIVKCPLNFNYEDRSESLQSVSILSLCFLFLTTGNFPFNRTAVHTLPTKTLLPSQGLYIRPLPLSTKFTLPTW